MSSDVRFHRLARIELVDAIAHVEKARRGYGARLEAEVDAMVERMVAHPHSGPLLAGYPPDLDARAFRLRTFRHALIAVEIGGERVVMAFAHERRRPGYWLDRVK